MHKTSDQEHGVEDYYMHSKENKCVACGEEGHYLRYRVVPACYRRNFPVQWKSHRSHDIVLLCVDCHHVAHRYSKHCMCLPLLCVKLEGTINSGLPLLCVKLEGTANSGLPLVCVKPEGTTNSDALLWCVISTF